MTSPNASADWIMERHAQGLSDQAISAIGRIPLPDVQKVTRTLAGSSRPTPAIIVRPSWERKQPRLIASGAFRVVTPGRLGPALRAIPGTMRGICMGVAQKYGLSLEALRGPQRTPRIAHPRQEAMYLMYASGRFSTTQIGVFLGDRDHTTVIHGIKAHAKRMAEGAIAA